METVLLKYLPEHAVHPCFELIKANHVHLKIVNERQTRHGDYRRRPDGSHQITVNASLNKYRFLITLIHEIAHLLAFEKIWANNFTSWRRMETYISTFNGTFYQTRNFPHTLLPLLARHFKILEQVVILIQL